MRYPSFKLNFGYYLHVSYKKNVDLRSKLKAADELSKKLRNLIAPYRKNLQEAQKLQKQAHNKGSKPKNYVPGKKVWLNSKYIKTKCNQKLNAKFFRPFQVLHLVDSQAYKLELLK